MPHDHPHPPEGPIDWKIHGVKVIPGDQLILRAKKTMERHSIYKFSCTACVGDELAASAEITIAEQRTQYHQS